MLGIDCFSGFNGIGVPISGNAEALDKVDSVAQRADLRVGCSSVHETFWELEIVSLRLVDPSRG